MEEKLAEPGWLELVVLNAVEFRHLSACEDGYRCFGGRDRYLQLVYLSHIFMRTSSGARV